MSNEGRISAEFSEDLLAKAISGIDAVYQLLPVHITLSEEERTGGFRLGDKTEGFLKKGKTYMEQAPQFIPAYVDKAETIRDANYAEKMLILARKLRPILTEIEDMAAISGIEALSSLLSYYNTVKDASKKGVPGAKDIYDDLQQRFPGRTKMATDKTPA